MLRITTATARLSSLRVVGHRKGTIALTQVQTALLNFVLPPDNIFGLEAGTTGQSVGDGWVALLAPLTPGTHEILIFTNGNQLASTNTIKVQPGA